MINYLNASRYSLQCCNKNSRIHYIVCYQGHSMKIVPRTQLSISGGFKGVCGRPPPIDWNWMTNNCQKCTIMHYFRIKTWGGDTPSPDPTALGAYGASTLCLDAFRRLPPYPKILDPPLRSIFYVTWALNSSFSTIRFTNAGNTEPNWLTYLSWSIVLNVLHILWSLCFVLF